LEIAVFLLIVVPLSAAAGVWASNRGRSGWGWFFLSILISPLLAFIFIAVSKDLSIKSAPSDGAGVHPPVPATPLYAAAPPLYPAAATEQRNPAPAPAAPVAPPAASAPTDDDFAAAQAPGYGRRPSPKPLGMKAGLGRCTPADALPKWHRTALNWHGKRC